MTTQFISLGAVCLALRPLLIAALLGAAPVPLTAVAEESGRSQAVARMSGTSPAEVGIQRWERLTRARPAEADNWVGLGNAWMQRSRDQFEEATLARAEAAFRQALGLDANHVGAMLGVAWVFNTQHEFDTGGQWANRVLELDPQQPDAHALLGDAAVERGDYASAFEHYQACLDLRPDLSSYSRAAHLLFLTGDVRRAQSLMRQAIAAGGPYPENVAWCRAQLARMMFDHGALVAAEKLVASARKDSPANPHLLAMAARLRVARRDYAEAVRLYEQAASTSPQPGILLALAEACELAGDPARAKGWLGRVRSAPGPEVEAEGTHQHGEGPAHRHSHADGNVELARYLADHDLDLDEALQHAVIAYRTFKNVRVTDTLAWCYFKRGLYEQAGKTIQKALKWRTPDAEMLFHAGMIQARLGDRVRARKHLYQALSLNPHFHPRHAQTAADTLTSLGGKGEQPGVATEAAAESTKRGS